MIWYLILIVAAFLVLWSSSDLVLEGVTYLAAKVKLADFWVSFFVLGMAMSAPEISVGINSVVDQLPEVYTGNLLGSTMAIFLMVIPVMAILGNGVTLIGKLQNRKILACFGLISIPFLLMVDNKLNIWEGLVCVMGYIALGIYFGKGAKEEKVVNSFNRIKLRLKPWFPEMVKFVFGVSLILFSGNVLLDSISFLVKSSGKSFYVLSFFLLSIGTTAPELMLVIKSLISKRREVAFGGYLGSAVANSMLFGLFSVAVGGFLTEQGIYFAVLGGSFVLGMILFYLFSKSKDELSRQEGLALIGIYIVIVMLTGL